MRLKARRSSLQMIAAAVLVLAAIAVVVVALATGSSRPAPATARPGEPLAMLEEDVNLLAHPARTLRIMRSLGVDVARLSVAWNTIAPDPKAHTSPPGFDASDPAAYPSANWAPYDRIVKYAQAEGIELDFLMTGGAPLWATGPGAPASERASGAWKPSPGAYGAFVSAVGTRYSGHYTPPGASSPLPAVRFWEIWNEPNWGPSLQPQLALGPVRIVAARRYRRLMDAAWGALQSTGHGGDTIVIGSLSPRGVSVPPQTRAGGGGGRLEPARLHPRALLRRRLDAPAAGERGGASRLPDDSRRLTAVCRPAPRAVCGRWLRDSSLSDRPAADRGRPVRPRLGRVQPDPAA